MQIVNLGELINKMGKGEVMAQEDIIDILGSFLENADIGEVHVHNCSKCGSNVHGNKVKKDNIKRNNVNTGKAKSSGHNGVPITGSNLSDEDIALLNFAGMYISAYKAGNNMEEYRKFFKDNVLPVPTLQDIAKYIK